MKSVFLYDDYRAFLREFFANKKQANPGYSLRVLSDKSGFRARDYVLRVMQGRRNLSQSSVVALSRGLGLSEAEAAYFENLVGFNQARSVRDKEHYLARLRRMRRPSESVRLRQDQFEYLSQWHHAAIRSILPVIDFGEDYAALGRFLDPPIGAVQVRRSVRLLLRLGLLERDSRGRYSVAAPALSTGDEVRSVALAGFHKSMSDLARRAVDETPAEERDIGGVTMTLSADGFAKVKEELRAVRKRVMEIAAADCSEDRAYQLSVHLFPLSKRKARQ